MICGGYLILTSTEIPAFLIKCWWGSVEHYILVVMNLLFLPSGGDLVRQA